MLTPASSKPWSKPRRRPRTPAVQQEKHIRWRAWPIVKQLLLCTLKLVLHGLNFIWFVLDQTQFALWVALLAQPYSTKVCFFSFTSGQFRLLAKKLGRKFWSETAPAVQSKAATVWVLWYPKVSAVRIQYPALQILPSLLFRVDGGNKYGWLLGSVMSCV